MPALDSHTGIYYPLENNFLTIFGGGSVEINVTIRRHGAPIDCTVLIATDSVRALESKPNSRHVRVELSA
jgi:hypothetical protein